MNLLIVLLVAFIDFFGVGLVYPLFSSMLFDVNTSLLAPGTSEVVRGLWLGILIALMPLAQFFCSPMWGAFSDGSGRKKPLLMSLLVALIGYVVAVCGVALSSLLLLLVSRIIIGVSSGNASVVQATISDLSSSEERGKNFGLFAMALGLGLGLGPFLGGVLSAYGYTVPFLFAAFITLINLLFAIFFFKETHLVTLKRKLKIGMAITELKEAFQTEGLKAILLSSFLYNFGFSYFFEFAPVFLIRKFAFSSVELGFFYGCAGGLYALSTGLLIRPFINRISTEKLFALGIFFAALMVFAVALIPHSLWLIPVMFFLCFFVSFVTPTSITLVSEKADESVQGLALGNLNAVNAAAFMLSPLFSGSLVGAYPSMPMWLGGGIMLVACGVFIAVFRKGKEIEKLL